MSPPSPLRPDLRAEWLLDERLTYLNHGSFGAVPRVVFETQTEWRRRIEAAPIEMLGRRAYELVAAAKDPLGEFLGMAPDDFGFVTNATEGVNTVLQSLDLRHGDELLTTNHVYPAVRQAMRLVAERAGTTTREVEVPLPVSSPSQITEIILGAISTRTRLLVIDHVTSPTALVFPIESITTACRERGVDVLVDGAHVPGMLPLDVQKVDAAYYTGNLHKWCCAPKGCAFLRVRPDRRSRIHPLVVSHHLGEGLAREFAWQGTRDLSAWLTLPRALEFMAGLGWDAVRRHNHEMAVWVQEMLCGRWGVEPISPLDGRLLGSMATVPLPPPLDRITDPRANALQQRLHDEFRLEVPLMRWGGRLFVRPCCQVYNTPEEYDRLATVIESIK